jgi:hypothetical protein
MYRGFLHPAFLREQSADIVMRFAECGVDAKSRFILGQRVFLAAPRLPVSET